MNDTLSLQTYLINVFRFILDTIVISLKILLFWVVLSVTTPVPVSAEWRLALTAGQAGRPPLFICSGWLENWTLGTNLHLWAGPKRETSPAPPAQPSLTCTDLVQINNILLYIIVLQISCNSISVNSELVQFVRGLQKQKYYLDDFNFIGVWKNCFKKYWR